MNLLSNRTSPLFGLLFIVTAMAPSEDSDEDPPSTSPIAFFKTNSEEVSSETQSRMAQLNWLSSQVSHLKSWAANTPQWLEDVRNVERLSAALNDLSLGLQHITVPETVKKAPHPEDWSQWDGLREKI